VGHTPTISQINRTKALMFQYQNNVRTHTNNTITIDNLVKIIKNNPKKDKIKKLHKVIYKSQEYDSIKLTLPCVKINGLFSSLKKDGDIKLNNYFYFDIDDVKNPNELKQELITKYPFITLISKSVGGRGIFFLVKVSGIKATIETHQYIWQHIRETLFSEYNIDEAAKGVARNTIIPYDSDLFFNKGGSFSVVKVSIVESNTKKVSKIKTGKGSNTTKEEEEIHITLNEPPIIPLNVLLSQIKTQTQYEGQIDRLYNVDPQDSYRLLIPEVIKDGTKHKLYHRLVNGLIFINAGITLQQVISYIHWVNVRAIPGMKHHKMIEFVTYHYNNIISTGEIKLKTRKKKIHFKMTNKDLTTRDKQVIAAKANGIIRTNTSIDKIQEAIDILAKRNEVITNQKISDITGLSLATVKRNKIKDKKDPMEFNNIKIESKETETGFNPQEINPEEFWGKI